MQLICISILRYNRDTSNPVLLCQASELSSFGFFHRSGIKEMCTFFSKTIVQRTQPGQRQSVTHESNSCYMCLLSVYPKEEDNLFLSAAATLHSQLIMCTCT